MSDLVHVRHTVSGVIDDVPQYIFDHEILGAHLERVDEDAKPFHPELHRAREADKSNDGDLTPDDEPLIVGRIDTIDPKDEK